MPTAEWRDNHADKMRAYRREWYAKNREEQVALAYQRKTERNAKTRVWLDELKSTLKCERCGENHPAVLDFHHTDPSSKDGNLAQVLVAGWSRKRILAEIEKCVVLCSNCHRKLHYEERRN